MSGIMPLNTMRDFVSAIYNPRSQTRTRQIIEAQFGSLEKTPMLF